MAPTPRIRYGEPLPANQTTILNSLRGISIQRPPAPSRPGPGPSTVARPASTVLGRRLVGGDNEKAVLSLFATFRSSRDVPEAGDEGIANGESPLEMRTKMEKIIRRNDVSPTPAKSN